MPKGGEQQPTTQQMPPIEQALSSTTKAINNFQGGVIDRVKYNATGQFYARLFHSAMCKALGNESTIEERDRFVAEFMQMRIWHIVAQQATAIPLMFAGSGYRAQGIGLAGLIYVMANAIVPILVEKNFIDEKQGQTLKSNMMFVRSVLMAFVVGGFAVGKSVTGSEIARLFTSDEVSGQIDAFCVDAMKLYDDFSERESIGNFFEQQLAKIPTAKEEVKQAFYKSALKAMGYSEEQLTERAKVNSGAFEFPETTRLFNDFCKAMFPSWFYEMGCNLVEKARQALWGEAQEEAKELNGKVSDLIKKWEGCIDEHKEKQSSQPVSPSDTPNKPLPGVGPKPFGHG